MQVVVGHVVRPHGIRGEVVVEPRTDQPRRRFGVGSEVRRPDGSTLTVASSRPHADRWLVRFVGVDDRDAADGLRGVALSAAADDPLDDAADEFPDVALVGLAVNDVSRREIGTVQGVEHSRWQDLLVVATPRGGVVRVPFVKAIVVAVDLEARMLVVDPPPGLLEQA